MNQRWQDISEKMQTDMETFSKEAASNTGHFLDQVRVENRQRYDYRSFLHKFAVLKEEVTVDDDSFDYVFTVMTAPLWKYASDRATGMERSEKSGGFCNRDRYFHVLFRRSGKKISGGDLWHFK